MIHTFDDGNMISEIVIDIALRRDSGRVDRAELYDLARVANEIRKQRDELKVLFEAAKAYIDEDPGNRDTTSGQLKAYEKYQELLKTYEDPNECQCTDDTGRALNKCNECPR